VGWAGFPSHFHPCKRLLLCNSCTKFTYYLTRSLVYTYKTVVWFTNIKSYTPNWYSLFWYHKANAMPSSVSVYPHIVYWKFYLLLFLYFFNFFFLNLQPVFSPSVLAEMMRPDGSSTISVLSGENLSTELAHELTAIQVTGEELYF